MIVPSSGRTLGEACFSLPDRLHTTPRFELPEWIWEELPRSNPALARSEIGRIAADLRLAEVTTSHDWLRFDCAGDFQLVPRSELFAIDALDERMTLGWHVDANLGRRMLLRHGSIESLAGEVAGYHCNHNRTTTTLQERLAVNDFGRFVVGVTDVDVPSQRDTWGLAGSAIEEIPLDPESRAALRNAVAAAVEASPSPPAETDARDEKWRLEHHSGHALSFVADALRTAPAGSQVAYLGVNDVLRQMLGDALGELGWPELAVVDGDRAEADLVVVDLGIDERLVGEPLATAVGETAAAQRSALRATFERFRHVVEHERASGMQRRPYVLVNSSAVYWNAFALAQLDVSPTTPHSGVRSATVKRMADGSSAAQAAERRADQLWGWISRHDRESRPLGLRTGERVELAHLDDYTGFGEGWRFPDRRGPMAAPPHVDLAFALDDGAFAGVDVELTLDRFGEDTAPPVATANGEKLESAAVAGDDHTVTWTIRVPAELVDASVARLRLDLPDGCRLLALVARRPGRGRLDHLVRSLVQSKSGRTTPAPE